MEPLLLPQSALTAEARAENPPMMATAIKEPIRPYSIAVAPDSSFQNFFNTAVASRLFFFCVKLNADSLTLAEFHGSHCRGRAISIVRIFRRTCRKCRLLLPATARRCGGLCICRTASPTRWQDRPTVADFGDLPQDFPAFGQKTALWQGQTPPPQRQTARPPARRRHWRRRTQRCPMTGSGPRSHQKSLPQTPSPQRIYAPNACF